MRKGYFGVSIMYSNRGNLLGIAAGSDACAEHEMGVDPLFAAMTTYSNCIKQVLIQENLKAKSKADIKFPDLFEAKRIVKHDEVKFVKVSKEEAYLWHCSWVSDVAVLKRQLTPVPSNESKGIQGAWDDSSFGFYAFNMKAVKALEEFYSHIKNNNVVFGGSIVDRDKFDARGLTLLVADRCKSSFDAGIKSAQYSFEDSVWLEIKAQAIDIRAQLFKAAKSDKFTLPGFLWPVWGNDEKTEVKFAMNPHCDVKADYYGPYSVPALIDWVSSGMSYHLTKS